MSRVQAITIGSSETDFKSITTSQIKTNINLPPKRLPIPFHHFTPKQSQFANRNSEEMFLEMAYR